MPLLRHSLLNCAKRRGTNSTRARTAVMAETFLFTSESVGDGHPGTEIEYQINCRMLDQLAMASSCYLTEYIMVCARMSV